MHELKAFFDPTYDDGGGNLVLCHEIQQYYEKHQYSTKVKAAGLLSLDEAKALAGVTAVTVAPDLLRILATTPMDEKDVYRQSLFREDNRVEENRLERKTYVDDEEGWRQAYGQAYGGKGQWKTTEVGLLTSQWGCLLTRLQGYRRLSRVPAQGRAVDQGYGARKQRAYRR